MLRKPLYQTRFGKAFVGDSLNLLKEIPDCSIDLVITSPPFALIRQKAYGNVNESEYVEWIRPFGLEVFRVLKITGSFILDLGGAYKPGVPSRSLYSFRVLITFCDEIGFHLAEDFYWHNSAKLPSPIEWVNKRKIRAKDSVNTVWWLSKTAFPKADVRNVLTPYSDRMKKLIEDPSGFYKPKMRPSGHDISSGFSKDNGGAIPSNLLSIPNTDSNSNYLRICKAFDISRHPARFPVALPEFFIKMLTDENDTVLDIFGGSNTTGQAAENLNRKWLTFEIDHIYLVSSVFRFIDSPSDTVIVNLIKLMNDDQANIMIDDIIQIDERNKAASNAQLSIYYEK